VPGTTPPEEPLTVHILSDSLGETADAVAKAAVSQFPPKCFQVERLPRVASPQQVRDLVFEHCGPNCIFFYTLAEEPMRDAMHRVTEELNVKAVDILGPAVQALALASDVAPTGEPGAIRKTDRGYFQRIEAMEFAVKHDDGRNPQGLKEAEIVLVGVSRTSKTPLSMYLASKGYRTANVPLAREMNPPPELFDVDPRRVFGLVSDPDLIAQIRALRTENLGRYSADYATREAVIEDLEDARGVLRKIGAYLVRTDNRAVEETAQEILQRLEANGLAG